MTGLCDVCGKSRGGKSDHARCAKVRQQCKSAAPPKKPSPLTDEQLRYFSKL